MSGTAAMINPLDAFNTPLETRSPAPGFELLIFATNWGFQRKPGRILFTH